MALKQESTSLPLEKTEELVIVPTKPENKSKAPRSRSQDDAKDITRTFETSPLQNEFDIDRILQGKDKRTTFMIRNIPNKYTQQMLLDCINSTHKNTYDFLYLRIDFKNKCNVGYAFINFTNVKFAVTFANERVGKRWNLFNSEKRCSLSYANIQGKDALVEKFKNSNVMEEDEAYRPKIFVSSGPNQGQEETFPLPTVPSEARRHRQQFRHAREVSLAGSHHGKK
ncbi:RNA recognition motif 2-domain-containing protein [Phycomyces blakesleeanus]